MRRGQLWALILVALLLLAGAVSCQQSAKFSEQGRSLLLPNEAPSSSVTSIGISALPSPPPVPQVDGQRLLRHLQNLSYERNTPALRSEARNYIIQSLKAEGWQVQTQRFKSGTELEGSNIVATRKGQKADTVLVGAHYDTVPESPGADDNASGVAIVLELARLFAKVSTLQTLQLVLFDQEEIGLVGSQAFVAGLAAHQSALKAVIVMDMVGYACYRPGCQTYPENLPITPPTDRGDFLAVLVDQEHAALLDAFASTPPLPPMISIAVPFKGLMTPDLLRSDHAPFWLQGIGAVFLSDTANFRSPHYHQPSDRLQTIDQPFLAGVAQLVVNATSKLLNQS